MVEQVTNRFADLVLKADRVILSENTIQDHVKLLFLMYINYKPTLLSHVFVVWVTRNKKIQQKKYTSFSLSREGGGRGWDCQRGGVGCCYFRV